MGRVFRVLEQCSGQSFDCEAAQSVLKAMEQNGMRCVPVGCRGGGCGFCKVKVLEGPLRECPPVVRVDYINGIEYLQGGVNDTKTKQIYMILIAVDLKTGKYTTIPQMAVMPVMILQKTFVD